MVLLVQDDCKVAIKPFVVSLSNHQRLLNTRPSASSGLRD